MTPKADLRVLSKDWPKASPVQAKRCREGGRRCPRCAALMAAGVNPYTLEPLGFPPFPPRPAGVARYGATQAAP